jgi:Ca-activated chloride channel family protein
MRLPRPIKNSLLPLLLVFTAQKVCAQLAPADDFFNSGAQAYISNNIPAALEHTEDGLKIYPNDDKLQKLEKLLKQQQQQQNQQNQSQQQQSQSKQNSKSQQNHQQNQQQSQQNSQDQKKPDEQKQSEQQKSSEQKSSGDKSENQNGENQTAAGQITPEEAKRLLDAQKGNEQTLTLKPNGKPESNNRPVKDW